MKKSILIAALGLFSLSAMAQDAKPEEGFVFTTVKENPITSIKNQNRSSTCWSFSTLGFVESELLRLGKGEYDLAEMFVVHKTMQDRGANYVRYHGDSSFSPGGSFYDVLHQKLRYRSTGSNAGNHVRRYSAGTQRIGRCCFRLH